MNLLLSGIGVRLPSSSFAANRCIRLLNLIFIGHTSDCRNTYRLSKWLLIQCIECNGGQDYDNNNFAGFKISNVSRRSGEDFGSIYAKLARHYKRVLQIVEYSFVVLYRLWLYFGWCFFKCVNKWEYLSWYKGCNAFADWTFDVFNVRRLD